MDFEGENNNKVFKNGKKTENNDPAKKSKKDLQEKRLDYLLEQAGLFAHFMNNKSATNEIENAKKSNSNPRKKKKKKLGSRNNDDEGYVSTENIVHYDATPSFINAVMRDYQIEGLNWLASLYENEINGILADDMGLGKTIQSIAMIGYLKNVKKINGPFLVVVPKSTINNWLGEFKRFCPSVKAFNIIGEKNQRKSLIKDQLLKSIDWDVCITTYDICTVEKTAFNRFSWAYIVLDEAHRIKNEKTISSRVLRSFHTKHRLMLTGTPLQNNLHELWSLLNFLLPDVFNSSDDFDTWFDSEECLKENNGIVERLHVILKPFMLRRIKSEVETSLLPKKEIKVYAGLSQMQREWYSKLLRKDAKILNGRGEPGKLKLLNMVMHLRKCANHPYLFAGAEPAGTASSEKLISDSGKMIVLDKLLAKYKAENAKVLIFSQFQIMLDIIDDYLEYRGYKFCRLDGGTTLDDRTKAMEEFNAPNSDKFVFILTTRAGGLGITLTAANIVIIFDSDWNPKADLQAMDRSHRIGQTKQVTVYRLITENTVDEKVVECAEMKLHLDNMVIQKAKIEAENLIEVVLHGAKYVLSSTDSDIVDEKIDAIIKRGEIKTKEKTRDVDLRFENKNLSNYKDALEWKILQLRAKYPTLESGLSVALSNDNIDDYLLLAMHRFNLDNDKLFEMIKKNIKYLTNNLHPTCEFSVIDLRYYCYAILTQVVVDFESSRT